MNFSKAAMQNTRSSVCIHSIEGEFDRISWKSVEFKKSKKFLPSAPLRPPPPLPMQTVMDLRNSMALHYTSKYEGQPSLQALDRWKCELETIN